MFDIAKVIWTLVNILIILVIIGLFIQCVRWLHELVKLKRSNQEILQQILEELRSKKSPGSSGETK